MEIIWGAFKISMMDIISEIAYQIPNVLQTTPIVIIGAGGIVQTAHLPAYKIAGYPVLGIFDIDEEKAKDLAIDFQIPTVYKSVEEMALDNRNNVIYDVAVPGNAILDILKLLPENAFVLLQKPMGENLEEAKAILNLCRQKNITAGVNFQLRYSPFIEMVKKMRALNLIGDISDIEVYVNTYTPWHLWDFLFSAPRVEMLYHSIHYVDLIRNLIGNPEKVFAKTTKHPKMDNLHSVKSNIIMDYGDMLRVNILTNHTHNYGPDKQDAYIKIEGTKGAIKIKLGLLLNYPEGIPDQFEFILFDDNIPNNWITVPVNGAWFPHAFIGSMAEMQSTKIGTKDKPDNSIEDAIYTMRCIEEAYTIGKL